MRSLASALVTLLALQPLVGYAFDAEFCGRGVRTAEELDRGHWEHYENVYVALVEKAVLVYPENRLPRVVFSLQVDEIFKGSPESTSSVYSQRVINEWNGDLEQVLMGGWIEVFVGDRLLVFSNQGEDVPMVRIPAIVNTDSG
ncbi:MAG: hypothetical protein H7A04_10350 [Pseudomonadales bacterium]|nr:hypothetical protein [Pseudomonadales bacterium]